GQDGAGDEAGEGGADDHDVCALAHRRARSSPSTGSRATNGSGRPSVDASTRGFAFRFRYQSGWRGAPPFEATSTTRSRAVKYRSGGVRFVSVFVPTC